MTMYTFLLISLFFLPIFYAERYQTELDNNNNQEMFVPRSVAASYLFSGLPVRRYRLLNSPMNDIPSDKDNPSPQRAKRIYWENLAFHAADFNQKAKKL